MVLQVLEFWIGCPKSQAAFFFGERRELVCGELFDQFGKTQPHALPHRERGWQVNGGRRNGRRIPLPHSSATAAFISSLHLPEVRRDLIGVIVIFGQTLPTCHGKMRLAAYHILTFWSDHNNWLRRSNLIAVQAPELGAWLRFEAGFARLTRPGEQLANWVLPEQDQFPGPKGCNASRPARGL